MSRWDGDSTMLGRSTEDEFFGSWNFSDDGMSSLKTSIRKLFKNLANFEAFRLNLNIISIKYIILI